MSANMTKTPFFEERTVNVLDTNAYSNIKRAHNNKHGGMHMREQFFFPLDSRNKNRISFGVASQRSPVEKSNPFYMLRCACKQENSGVNNQTLEIAVVLIFSQWHTNTTPATYQNIITKAHSQCRMVV
jgi:hypothetical protein